MSSGFVTEAEATEARIKRQQEWENVRKPDQPLELPEVPYDSRSLFERLKEQKDRKDLEFEEAHKLKNLIRGLNDEEIDFLELVDKKKLINHNNIMMEDKLEIEEFRQRVATLQEQSQAEEIQKTVIKAKPSDQIGSKRLSQKSILSSGVVLKKRKLNDEDVKSESNKNKSNDSGMKVIAILPGLGNYESSSSETDDDEDSNFDLIGRSFLRKKNGCNL